GRSRTYAGSFPTGMFLVVGCTPAAPRERRPPDGPAGQPDSPPGERSVGDQVVGWAVPTNAIGCGGDSPPYVHSGGSTASNSFRTGSVRARSNAVSASSSG